MLTDATRLQASASGEHPQGSHRPDSQQQGMEQSVTYAALHTVVCGEVRVRAALHLCADRQLRVLLPQPRQPPGHEIPVMMWKSPTARIALKACSRRAVRHENEWKHHAPSMREAACRSAEHPAKEVCFAPGTARAAAPVTVGHGELAKLPRASPRHGRECCRPNRPLLMCAAPLSTARVG